MSDWIEIGTKPIPITVSKPFDRDDYDVPIVEKFISGLQEYFKISREEVVKRGSTNDAIIFDNLFTPDVIERNNPTEIEQIYANTPYFAFRNPIYYANREFQAFEPFWKPITEKHGSVLDHGGGAGVFIEVLLRKGVADITYTDIPSPVFEFVKWFFGDKIKYENDPNNIQGFYDYITSNSVLEHLPDPIKTIRMFGEHLKLGGKIIASMATDIHGQHLKKAIDKYNEVMSLIGEINRKSQIYYDIQISGSAWTTKNPHYQELLKESIAWVKNNLPKEHIYILDLGCGDAWSIEEFKRQGLEVTGGDIDTNKLEDAKKRGVKVEYQDMHNVTNIWNVVFCSHSLEHSLNWKKALDSIIESLIIYGSLFLIVPIEPTDPKTYNPSHTQWFSDENIIRKYLKSKKDIKIRSEQIRQRDSKEYWLIVDKIK